MSRLANPLDRLTQPQGSQQQANQPSSTGSPGSPQPQPDQIDRLTQVVEQVSRQSSQAQTLASLAMDPDFAALLAAKQAGKQVSLQIGTPERKAPEMAKPIEEMTEQEKITYLLENMDVLAEKKAKAMVQPVEQQLGQVQRLINAHQQNEANQQIANATAKYSDFKELLPIMTQLQASVAPGANCDQLYLLACQATNRSPRLAQAASSERPTSQTARPPLAEGRKEPLPPGRAGFSQALREATARLDLSSFPEDAE